MFVFSGRNCKFVTPCNLYGNRDILVLTEDGEFLYQLTEEIHRPIPQDTVVFKAAPFIYQFLVQIQNSGLLHGKLERYMFNDGKEHYIGKLQLAA